MSKTLLITGATGKQGSSVINALANNPSFTLLAVTRQDASSASSQTLKSKGKNIQILQGDLNDTPKLFADAQKAAESSGGLWGVYSVQLSVGKGVTHEGEIAQGKAMVDESVKAGVKHFVYSSVDRGGNEKSWETETPIPHFQSKYAIENHLKEKAGDKMGWTVLRPVAFMDNLEPGFQTQVFMAAMRDTLKSKPCQWVATRDIGIFVKNAFSDPQTYNHMSLGLAGDNLTSAELSLAFKNKTGQPLGGTWWFLGSFLKYMVGELGLMIDWFANEGYGCDIAECKRLHPGLMNMEEWIVKESKFTAKA